MNTRPRVNNADGSVSTVRSISANIDGKEVLMPTVSDDGRIMSNDEAVKQYETTGKHLGIFRDEQSATAYAQQLHESEAARFSTKVNDGAWRLRPITPGASLVMVPGKDGGPPVEYRYLPSKQGLSFNEYSKKLADESAARKVQGTQQQQDDKSFANEAGPIESN